MNKKYDKAMALEDLTRKRIYKLNKTDAGGLVTNRHLWKGVKDGIISWPNLKFLEEDMYLNIPKPFKQQ